MDQETNPNLDLIYSYSRAQAIDDGVLVDVGDMARQAGFVVPVALTTAAWADCVTWADADSRRQTPQDESGRLWDVLWMAYLATRRATGGQVEVTLFRVPRDGRSRAPRAATLQMHIGPGDQGEPVITIMMPGED